MDIVVFDGVDELDAIGPFEVLRMAEQAGAPFEVRLVTHEPRTEVVGAHGLRFDVGGVLDAGADVVLVGGGGWLTRSPAGAWAEAERGKLPRALAEAAEGASVMASVCTGSMLLARAGLIGGRRATTHHGASAELEATGAVVVGDRVVDDGSVVTAAGVTSGIDLALWIVERFASRDMADKLAAAIEYQRERPATAP